MNLNKAYLKSSIISMMSKELENNFDTESKTLNRYIKNDLNKEFFKELESLENIDYLVIDFFEETFDLLKFKDETFLTNTWQLRESNIIQSIEVVEILKSQSIQKLNLWKEKCIDFIEILKKKFNSNQIILHRAILAENYKDNKNNILKFKNKEAILESNKTLNYLYDFFEENYKDINIYKPKIRNINSNINHPWGNQPHNLEENYYDDFENHVNVNILKKIKKISIFGSCDSRDIFRVYEENFEYKKYEIDSYIARTSILSLYETPLAIKIDYIDLKSNFKKNCLYSDVNKKTIENISQKNSDILIVDFMEERFDIVRISNSNSTYSWEFRESNISKIFDYKVLNRTLDLQEIWEDKCLKFIEDIKKLYNPSQILLHEAYMVSTYQKNGKIYKFKDEEYINDMNLIFKKYYNFFKENFPEIKVFSYEQNKNYCDYNHLWGCQPYHFNNDYYLEAEKYISENF